MDTALSLEKRQLGFTLIELVTVMALLSILVTLAVPRAEGLVDRARIRTDEQNVGILNSATELFAAHEDKTVGEIFAGCADDTARMNMLVSQGYLKEVPVPAQEGKSFQWDTTTDPANPRWTLAEVSSGGGEPPAPPPYPAWDAATAYTAGSYVTHHGKVFYARYYANPGQTPGVVGNPWQEITDQWRAFNVYQGGDTVKYQGKTFTAWYYTMNQEPGVVGNPWQEATDQWREFNRYYAGDVVKYKGKQYKARWYSFNEVPGVADVWQRLD